LFGSVQDGAALAPELGIEGWRSEIDRLGYRHFCCARVHVRNREWVWAAPPCCCLADAVWWGGMGALLPLGRQSNEGKRQCKAGDEGQTQDACALDLRSYFGFRVLDITKSRKGFGLIKYNSLDLDTSFGAATVCRP
jgi:hypothetical protein